MYNAGCRYIGFEAESASPRMLELMGKGGSMLKYGVQDVFGFDVPRTMTVGIKNTIEAGIHANCTWIMGYPGETLADLQATVAFIKMARRGLMASYEGKLNAIQIELPKQLIKTCLWLLLTQERKCSMTNL